GWRIVAGGTNSVHGAWKVAVWRAVRLNFVHGVAVERRFVGGSTYFEHRAAVEGRKGVGWAKTVHGAGRVAVWRAVRLNFVYGVAVEPRFVGGSTYFEHRAAVGRRIVAGGTNSVHGAWKVAVWRAVRFNFVHGVAVERRFVGGSTYFEHRAAV